MPWPTDQSSLYWLLGTLSSASTHLLPAPRTSWAPVILALLLLSACLCFSVALCLGLWNLRQECPSLRLSRVQSLLSSVILPPHLSLTWIFLVYQASCFRMSIAYIVYRGFLRGSSVSHPLSSIQLRKNLGNKNPVGGQSITFFTDEGWGGRRSLVWGHRGWWTKPRTRLTSSRSPSLTFLGWLRTGVPQSMGTCTWKGTSEESEKSTLPHSPNP